MDEPQERTYLLGLHLSGLAWLIGIPGFIGPLVMWLIKRDESAAVDAHGKQAVNFHLSLFIYWLAFVVVAIFAFVVMAILTFGVVPLLLMPMMVLGVLATFVMVIVFPVIAAVKAQDGILYRYPLAIPLLK